MTSNFEIKFSGSTDPFDDYFIETHGGTKATWEDDDVDDVDYDKMTDTDDL